ncbi:MAG TPA: alpha/beta hydrolase [Acidimicrobiales bacterium]|nr:alpha/beta hydrolase [Acidimicrobiales bacterium]
MTEPTPHPSTTERRVAIGDVELHVVEAGPADGFPVVLSHGFPELSYSWRHQVPALADAGYRVICPDQRGYGRSDRPEAIEDYDIHHLTGDLLGLLDEAGHERAVFIGHDWGSMVVNGVAGLHPERVAGVLTMSVPLLPRPGLSPIDLFKMAFGDSFFYMLYFQEPGVADAELGADPAETMTRMLAGLTLPDDAELGASGLSAPDGTGFVDRLPKPDGLPAWLSQAELDHYIAEFSRTGFTGGINWYRNLHRNWETTPQLEGAQLTVPSAFVTGAKDPVNLMSPAAVMEGYVTDHRFTILVDGAGHWVQQEKPAEVNPLLLDFLSGLDLPKGGS